MGSDKNGMPAGNKLHTNARNLYLLLVITFPFSIPRIT